MIVDIHTFNGEGYSTDEILIQCVGYRSLQNPEVFLRVQDLPFTWASWFYHGPQVGWVRRQDGLTWP